MKYLKYVLIVAVLALVVIEVYRNVELNCRGFFDANVSNGGSFSEAYVGCRVTGWHYFILDDLGLAKYHPRSILIEQARARLK